MPLARHDRGAIRLWTQLWSFYSHASCEAWRCGICTDSDSCSFYSHASCEAWLYYRSIYGKLETFLLTCLLRGMTAKKVHERVRIKRFYSHASCEAWHLSAFNSRYIFSVSTHMPLARHDISCRFLRLFLWSFYSHASCEAWQEYADWIDGIIGFYSHASCEAWHKRLFPCMTMVFVSTHMPLARHDTTTTTQ